MFLQKLFLSTLVLRYFTFSQTNQFFIKYHFFIVGKMFLLAVKMALQGRVGSQAVV